MEVIQLPCGEIISNISRHTVSTEIGMVHTGTAHATLLVKSAEEEATLKDWSQSNGTSETTNWHGITIRAHIPRLHSCLVCSAQSGKEIFGHDTAWCRKRRPALHQKQVETETDHAPRIEQNQLQTDESPIEGTSDSRSIEAGHQNTDEKEDGEIDDDGTWYQQTKKHRKRENGYEVTPSSTPAKNKFQAFADAAAKSSETSPRSRSPNPQKQLFDG